MKSVAFLLFMMVASILPRVGGTQDQTIPQSGLSFDQKEEFLKNGNVINERLLSTGVTHSMRVTLQYHGIADQVGLRINRGFTQINAD